MAYLNIWTILGVISSCYFLSN